MTETISYEKALENLEIACWYLNQLIEEDDENAIDILQGLVEVSEVLYDCQYELCERCGSYKNEYGEIGCDNCRWKNYD